MSKYKSKKTVVDGIEFDSKREARRWLVLRELEKNGQISDLERQVKFELIPAQRRPDGKGKMRVVERAVGYVADFVYIKDGEVVAEDTKGFRTRDYTIKRKLMLFINNVRVREV